MVKWYITEDNLKSKITQPSKPTRLRGGIKPGQVLILLAGKHQGKRVIFLKQLGSGNLLVTGPYKLNGVVLKRVPQSYTIPTSSQIDIAGIDTSAVTDQYFAKEKKKQSKSEKAFFAPEKKQKEVPENKKATQKDLDLKIAAKMSQELKKYVSTKFSLRNGVYPHTLKF